MSTQFSNSARIRALHSVRMALGLGLALLLLAGISGEASAAVVARCGGLWDSPQDQGGACGDPEQAEFEELESSPAPAGSGAQSTPVDGWSVVFGWALHPGARQFDRAPELCVQVIEWPGLSMCRGSPLDLLRPPNARFRTEMGLG